MDVIVIGGGLAGLLAAVTAATRGARVLVLSSGKGTLGLSSGGIDLLARGHRWPLQSWTGPGETVRKGEGPFPGGFTLDPDGVESGFKTIASAEGPFPGGFGLGPRHPYVLAGGESLRKGLELFLAAMEWYHNTYLPSWLVHGAAAPERTGGAGADGLPGQRKAEGSAHADRRTVRGKAEGGAVNGGPGQGKWPPAAGQLPSPSLAQLSGGRRWETAPTGAGGYWLPTMLGFPRPTDLAPLSLSGGDLRMGKDMVIVGLEGLADFYPTLLAENLRKVLGGGYQDATEEDQREDCQKKGHQREDQQKGEGLNSFKETGNRSSPHFQPFQVRTVRMDPGLGRVSPLYLASELDRDGELRHRVLRGLRKALRPGERVGVAGVLGRRGNRELIREWGSELGTEIFEIPLASISLPGLRAWEGLEGFARRLGVEIRSGLQVTGVDVQGQLCRAVETTGPEGRQRFTGNSFILATGGVLGGGLAAGRDAKGQSFWREAVFGLPVAVTSAAQQQAPSSLRGGGHGKIGENGLAASRRQPAAWTDEAEPSFSRLGLEVDDGLRPLVDGGRRLLAENLFAAGRILGHYDPWEEGSGHGVAMATGFFAGQLATRWR